MKAGVGGNWYHSIHFDKLSCRQVSLVSRISQCRKIVEDFLLQRHMALNITKVHTNERMKPEMRNLYISV
jgi:hypothetical protein